MRTTTLLFIFIAMSVTFAAQASYPYGSKNPPEHGRPLESLGYCLADSLQQCYSEKIEDRRRLAMLNISGDADTIYVMTWPCIIPSISGNTINGYAAWSGVDTVSFCPNEKFQWGQEPINWRLDIYSVVEKLLRDESVPNIFERPTWYAKRRFGAYRVLIKDNGIRVLKSAYLIYESPEDVIY